MKKRKTECPIPNILIHTPIIQNIYQHLNSLIFMQDFRLANKKCAAVYLTVDVQSKVKALKMYMEERVKDYFDPGDIKIPEIARWFINYRPYNIYAVDPYAVTLPIYRFLALQACKNRKIRWFRILKCINMDLIQDDLITVVAETLSKNDPYFLREFNDETNYYSDSDYLKVCRVTLGNDGENLAVVQIDRVKDFYSELCLIAVKQSGMSLEHVRTTNLSKEEYLLICEAAIEQNEAAKKYIKI